MSSQVGKTELGLGAEAPWPCMPPVGAVPGLAVDLWS